MTLEEIFEHWNEDSVISGLDLSNESLKIPKLHYKYTKFYSNEKMLLKKIETDYKVLYKLKMEYFLGSISNEDLKEHGWEPNPLKILRADLEHYIQSDFDIRTITLKIAYQKEKTEVLHSIITMINTRGFHIKNANDNNRFMSGN